LGQRVTVGPIRAINPRGLFLLIALTVAKLFRVRNGEIDDILAVDRVDYTVLSEIADDLHFDHSTLF
jgi:hypothetical protein